MNRRGFLKLTAVAVPGSIAIAELGGIGAAELFLTSCNGQSPSWVNNVLGILNYVLPAAEGVFNIVAAFTGIPVNPALVTTISAAVSEVVKLINDWLAAAPPDQPGIMGNILKASQFLVSELQGILNAIHVTNQGLQAKVMSIANFILSEVTTLVSVFASLVAGKVTAARRQAKAIPVTNPKDFKKLYNEKISIPNPPNVPQAVNDACVAAMLK